VQRDRPLSSHVGLTIKIDGKLTTQNMFSLDTYQRFIAVNEAVCAYNEPHAEDECEEEAYPKRRAQQREQALK